MIVNHKHKIKNSKGPKTEPWGTLDNNIVMEISVDARGRRLLTSQEQGDAQTECPLTSLIKLEKNRENSINRQTAFICLVTLKIPH